MEVARDAGSAPGLSHRRSLLRTAAVVAALAICGGGIAYAVTTALRAPSSGTALELGHGPLHKGSPAPAFSLTRLGSGGPVRLTTRSGHPVILNFFASWCADCRAELSTLAAGSHSVAATAASVTFIGIDSNDPSPGAARSLLAGAHATYVVGIDRNESVAALYDVPGLPTTFAIDGNGLIAAEVVGRVTHSELDRLIGEISGR
ncbi:MAG: TlpA family protein disulfide reductase [Acidimicrobiales bacterium]